MLVVVGAASFGMLVPEAREMLFERFVRLNLVEIAKNFVVIPLQYAGEACSQIDSTPIRQCIGEVRISPGLEDPTYPITYGRKNVNAASICGAEWRLIAGNNASA